MTSPFLSEFFSPVTVGNTSSYSLRGSHKLQNIACRANLYLNPSLPSVVIDWNASPTGVRDLDSLSASLKRYNIRDVASPNKLYFSGDRRIQVINGRLRTKCKLSGQN